MAFADCGPAKLLVREIVRGIDGLTGSRHADAGLVDERREQE
jgi:hypothetical protein